MPLIESLLREGHTLHLRVTGRSMRPTLMPGDVVRVAACREKPEPGDLVLVSPPNSRPVMHRVLAVDASADGGTRVQTRGDALRIADPWMPLDAVVGRVERVVRRGLLQRLGAVAFAMRRNLA